MFNPAKMIDDTYTLSSEVVLPQISVNVIDKVENKLEITNIKALENSISKQEIQVGAVQSTSLPKYLLVTGDANKIEIPVQWELNDGVVFSTEMVEIIYIRQKCQKINILYK